VISAKPHNTIMRAPGHFQGAFVTEACVEAAATQLGSAGWSLLVQEANMDSDVLNGAWAQMKASCNPEQRLQACQAFNALNRYRKQGVYCMPCLYSMDTTTIIAKTVVTVNSDGTVTIDSSGIEMGQGINTKVIQACAMSLGAVAPVDVSQISTVLVKSTDQFGAATPTWGSGTSEACVRAVMKAGNKLAKRMKRHAGSGKTWTQVVADCVAAGVNLSDSESNRAVLDGAKYPISGACMTHVEIDVLTGETEVLDAQIFYDCGKSLNPAVDIGQVEGCFIQGLGFSLVEKIEHDSAGRLLSNGTWDYRLPTALDVPHNMEVHFLNTSNDARGNVLGSKASGEPAMLMSTCPFFAVKQAIYAARQEAGDSSWFQLDAPADPPTIAEACKVGALLGQ
jgi:xanthine dehydrogenase molybdopterin-binding subunit B